MIGPAIKNIRRAALLAGLLLCSCIKPDDIRIVEIEQWGMETLTRPVITVRVRNDSRRNVQVQSGRFTVSTPSGKVAEVMLIDEVTVPKKSETSITLPLRVKISNPFAAASVFSGKGVDTDRIFITGTARVRSGAMKRDFAVTDAPVSRFVSIFGVDPAKDLPVYEIQPE